MKWLTIVEREILQVNHASTSSYSFSILVSNVFTVQWITLYQNIQPLCAVDYFHYFLLFSLLGDYFEKSYNFVDLLYTILNFSLTLFFFYFLFLSKKRFKQENVFFETYQGTVITASCFNIPLQAVSYLLVWFFEKSLLAFVHFVSSMTMMFEIK